MAIRKATVQDIEQISLLFIEQFNIQAAWNPYLMQSGTQNKQFIEDTITNAEFDIFVAEESGKIVGFISIFEKTSPDFNFMVPHKYAYLMDIIITKEHRGKGLAAKLMNEIKQWALDRKLDHIELSVFANNSAVDFYIKCGYEETGKTMICKL